MLIKKSFQSNQNNVKQVDDLENLHEEEEKKHLLDMLQQKKKDERKNMDSNESENSIALLSK